MNDDRKWTVTCTASVLTWGAQGSLAAQRRRLQRFSPWPQVGQRGPRRLRKAALFDFSKPRTTELTEDISVEKDHVLGADRHQNEVPSCPLPVTRKTVQRVLTGEHKSLFPLGNYTMGFPRDSGTRCLTENNLPFFFFLVENIPERFSALQL